MSGAIIRYPGQRWDLIRFGVILLALTVAAVSARPYAGGWNDGSRLATVETLVDQGTLVIDDSSFVRARQKGSRSPYDPAIPGLASTARRTSCSSVATTIQTNLLCPPCSWPDFIGAGRRSPVGRLANIRARFVTG